jgi:hypothetical protein
MPNLSGFPALDVAIGLAFMFFLLATACSAINELIANLLGWRAKTLEDAVRNLLGDEPAKSLGQRLLAAVRGAIAKLGKRSEAGPRPEEPEEPDRWGRSELTGQVFEHWRIASLTRDPGSKRRRRRRPSYLPARAFSLAVAETLAKGPQEPSDGETPWQMADSQLLGKAEDAIGSVPPLGRPLLHKAAANAFGDLEHFRSHLETAFNDAMERASGWYKRKVTVAVAVIAAAFAFGLNVDTVQVASKLWKDPAVRTAVAAKASSASQQGGAAQNGQAQQSPAQRAASEVDRVKQLELPLGWGANNRPHDVGGYVRRIPGWLITIAALSLGAPFWFDLLSRVARLRGSGVPEKPRTLSDRAGASG